MDRRSTSVKGFVHYGGEVRSGVEDGLGFFPEGQPTRVSLMGE